MIRFPSAKPTAAQRRQPAPGRRSPSTGARNDARLGWETRMSDPYWASVTALIPQLRGYAIALTRSSAEADDLVQECLTRAWRFRDGFTQGTNLKAWLYK